MMNENLEAAQRDGSLTAEETARLMRNGFLMSWAADDAKAGYIKRIDDYVAAAGQ